jgi:hypothetical protein
MALKDQAINLVLRAKNLLSADTDAAARSVEDLAGSAEGLEGKLRELEDQGKLISQFQKSKKAVDSARSAWERANDKVDRLKKSIKTSGEATEVQARQLREAEQAAERAAKGYGDAEEVLGEFGKEAEDAGVNLENLGIAQRENAAETKKAKAAQEKLNRVVDESDSKLKAFRGTLSKGITTFVKWGAAATAAGAALTVGALTRFTSSQADLARQTLASAEAFGISAEALQKWKFAGEQVGIGGEKVADIMKDLGDKIGDAFLTGGGEAREVIAGLNIDIEKLVKLSPDKQIQLIAQELEGMPKAGQIQILEALANDASLLLPLLADSGEKLRELGQAAEERGVIFTDEELEKLAEVDRAFLNITTRIQGFGKEVVSKLAPAFTEMAKTIDDALADKPELVDKISKGFVGLIEKTSEWVSSIIDNKDDISASFLTVGNTVDGVRLLFVSLFRAVQSFGAGASEIAARTVFSWKSAGLAILEVRNSIGLASDEAVESARFALDAVGQSVLDLKKQSEDYQTQMIAAGNEAAIAFGKARDGAVQVGAAVVDATLVVLGLADATGGLSDKQSAGATSAEKLAIKQAQLSTEIQKVALALEIAGAAMDKDSTPEQAAEVAKLRKEYEELLKTQKLLNEEEQNLTNPTNGADKVETSGASKRYQEQAEAVKSVNKALQDANKSTKVFVKTVDTGFGDSAERVKRFGESAKASAGSVGAAIGSIFSGWANHVARLSKNAGAAFQEALGGRASSAATELENKLATVNNRLADMKGRLVGIGPLGGILREWATAAFETEKKFYDQAIAVETLTNKILEGDRASSLLNKTAKQIGEQFDLLDDNQLRPLIGAIQSARREVEGLNQSLLDTIASTKQELAALSGDTAEVERLRYLERQTELQDQLNNARELGDKETIRNAVEALRLTELAYRERQRQAEEQSATERKRALEREANSADDRIRDEKEERQDTSRTEKRTQTQTTQLDRASSRSVKVDFSSGGNSLGSLEGSERDVDNFLNQLEGAGFLSSGG